MVASQLMGNELCRTEYIGFMFSMTCSTCKFLDFYCWQLATLVEWTGMWRGASITSTDLVMSKPLLAKTTQCRTTDNSSSRSLVCPNIATVQRQLCLYTNKNCPEIVQLLNVIASTATPCWLHLSKMPLCSVRSCHSHNHPGFKNMLSAWDTNSWLFEDRMDNGDFTVALEVTLCDDI